MDGYQTTQMIRQYFYENNIEQPIITAVTGHTEQQFLNRAFQSGIN